jgi:hypothetical protein
MKFSQILAIVKKWTSSRAKIRILCQDLRDLESLRDPGRQRGRRDSVT